MLPRYHERKNEELMKKGKLNWCLIEELKEL